MQKNFALASGGAEIVVEGRTVDLHNLYDARRIATDRAGAIATLVFERGHRWTGSDRLPERVTLTCSGNLHIAFNDLCDAPVPLNKDAVELQYDDADCDWDEFLDERLAASQGFAGLHLSFSAGFVLRIRCDLAEITMS